jgi:fibronectin-binding autotransporter adhesin
MRSVENKKTWLAMAALATAVAISPQAMGQTEYTWDSSGSHPTAPVDGSGNWNTTTADWAYNGSDVVWPNNTTSIAVFGHSGTAGTVTVQTPVTAEALLFNPVSSGTYTIAGTNTITLGGNAAIGVEANANISAPIGGTSGLLFGGTGTLNLSGANTYTGATVLDGGTLQLGSATALPATTALTVNSVATLDVNGQTPTAASLAGAGNVLLESGSNLIVNQTTTTTFSGTLTGSGTLTKENTGVLTITSPQPSFTGKVLFSDPAATINGQLVLSGNANINNATIQMNDVSSASGGPYLCLNNLATPLTAPITFTPTSTSGRFYINVNGGTSNVVSSPITANFLAAGDQLLFYSNTTGGSMSITSTVTDPNGTAGNLVFRGADTESFTGTISAANTSNPSTSSLTVATTDAGSCYFDPQAGSKWGQTTLGGTYTFQIPNDGILTTESTPISGATNGLQFAGGKLQLVNYTSNLSFVQANMSGTNILYLGAAAGGTATENGSINLTGANPVNFTSPGTLIMNGNVTTGSTVTFAGPGIIQMNGSVTATGAVSLTGGTLQLGNSNIFPVTSSPTVPSGATLDLNGKRLEVESITSAGNIMLTGSGSELYLDGSSGSITGTLSGAGQLYESTGTLTVSGNNTSFSGTTNINGTITLGSATALGTGDVDNYGTLAIGTYSPTLGSLSGYAGTITGSGNLTVGSDNNSATYGGAIDTTGSLTVVGNGTFTLGGSTSTYTGATNVNFGTLQLDGGYGNVLPTTTALTIASGATLDMQGDSQQVVSLAGAGSIINLGQLAITAGTTTTFSGSITDNGSGGSLTINEGATNILTLTGSSSYTGGTTITGGTVAINSDAALGGAGASVTVNGGILKFSNYTSNLIVSGNNIFLGAGTGAASTLAGSVTSSAGVTYNGPGTLILTSTSNSFPGTTIAGGNLQFGAGAFSGGSITMTAGALNITGAFPTVASALPSITTSSTGAVALTGDSSENIDFTSNGGYANLFLGAAANSNYTGTITPANGTYNLGGGGATLTLPNANALTGSNNLVVANSTVALTNSNNFTGTITLTSGTLAIASDAAINNGNGAGGIIFNGGTLQFNNYATSLPLSSYTTLKLGAASGTSSTLNSALTSATSLTYQGPGTLLIGSSVTLPTALALTANAGTLDLNGTNQTVASLTGAGTINTETGSTLTDAMKAGTTFSGKITGSGTFTINNAQATASNTLTISAASTTTGAVNITQVATGEPTNVTLSAAGSFNSASGINITNNVATGSTNTVNVNLSSLTSPITAPLTINLQPSGSADTRAFIINTAGANTIGLSTMISDITLNSTNSGSNFSSFTFQSNSGTLTLSGPITVNGTDPQFVLRGTGAGVLNSLITMNSPTLTLAKTDTGTWLLDPALGSTWTAQSIGSGTLEMGRANVLPPTILMPITGTSTLDLYGFNQTVGGLTSGAGSEIVTSTNGAATLTIAVPASTSDEFGSASSDAISGPLTITIAGPGTETFGNSTTTPTVLNNANTYTGGTNLNGGTLIFNNTSTVNNLGTGPISFNGGALTYNGTANTYDLTTHGLTINSGGATINIGTNTVTFANAITGGGPLTKSGTGTLTLSAPVNFSALTVSAGGLHIAAGGNTVAGTLAINGSSIVQLDGNTTAGKLSGDGTGMLNITAGKVAATAQAQSTFALKALSISPGAILDLDNGNLAIDYGTGTDPYSTIIAEIKNGYDLGTWDGGTPVTGSIISSASIGHATALGYTDNTTTHQVEVKYTWYGDLNLDGVVNNADLTLMNDGQPGWVGGDLNYDGIVNADDYALLMYGSASQNGSIASGVPEPTGVAMLLAPAIAALARRRRATNR